MDPVRNPYTPGAGDPPPELAGRDEIRERVGIVLERLEPQQPIMVWRLVLRTNAKPFMIRIECLRHIGLPPQEKYRLRRFESSSKQP